MKQEFMYMLSNVTHEEMVFLETVIKEMSEEQQKNFIFQYSAHRKDPNTYMIFILLGFVGVAGIHRFVTDQIGMGILYVLTAGLCYIGTIVDLINYKSLVFEYNKTQAYQVLARM